MGVANQPVLGSMAAPSVSAEAALPSEPIGVQKISTGWAGALTMLLLYIALTRFQARVPAGGPLWESLWGFPRVSRDFVDVFLCLLATFAVMILWDKAMAAFRWLALAIVAAGAAAVARGGAEMHTFLGQIISQAEIALLTTLGLLILLLGADLWVRLETGRVKPIPQRRQVSWAHALRSGALRWLALWCVVSLATVVYNGAKVYAGYPPGTETYYFNWRVTSVFLWWLFTLVGPIYCVLTVKLRSCLTEDRTDVALTLLMLARRTWRLGPAEMLRLLRIRRVRASLLDLTVKFFWLPIMTTFLFNNCGSFHRGLDGALAVFQREGVSQGLAMLGNAFISSEDADFLEHVYHTLFFGLFLVDVAIGLLGYMTASRWLGTKSKSVETTMLGWSMALACYPPFNKVTADIIPYHHNHGLSYFFFVSPFLRHFLMLLTLLLLTVYVWATVAFGLRFSNLTHRGVIDTGPYRYIRHPAYISKNLSWWTENILNFGSPWQFLYILIWNYVYSMRAWTEEKHLLQFEDYRRYCRKVRWRFIPGIF